MSYFTSQHLVKLVQTCLDLALLFEERLSKFGVLFQCIDLHGIVCILVRSLCS